MIESTNNKKLKDMAEAELGCRKLDNQKSSADPEAKQKNWGGLQRLPSELIIHILGFLSFKDIKMMTTRVSRDFNSLRRVPALWKEISTDDIPFSVLLSKIIPAIKAMKSACVTSLTVRFMVHYLTHAQRVITYFAQNHEIKQLTFIQSTGVLKRSRFDNILKLLRETPSFQKVTHFTVSTSGNAASNSHLHFCHVLEMLAWFPNIKTLSYTSPMPEYSIHYPELITTAQIEAISTAGALLRAGLRQSHCYLTRLEFTTNTELDLVVVRKLGKWFPELEYASLYAHASLDTVDKIKKYDNYYKVVHPLPRFREMRLKATGNGLDWSLALSALFFSLIYQSKSLEVLDIDTSAGHNGLYEPKVDIFCAIKHWKKEWKGMKNKSLKHLRLKNCNLEYDLLHRDHKLFTLPNLRLYEVPDCVNLKKDETVHYMRSGGYAPIAAEDLLHYSNQFKVGDPVVWLDVFGNIKKRLQLEDGVVYGVVPQEGAAGREKTAEEEDVEDGDQDVAIDVPSNSDSDDDEDNS
ncbi:Protein of unknown function [Pyronema omphalodes CBS 100304]|uniref:F-box domain-containing protein n=1 Tax=Pyronema omphalodes (strain CBS 100304) TaxID=1076935 RepID=U4L3P4_PYROM|nr:Protein of unknown function [Pyronema omphalodes CBS 100304]